MEGRVFTIGLITGIALTAAVSYGIAPAIASLVAKRAVMQAGNRVGLPSALSQEFANNIGPIAAQETRALL